MEPAHNANFRPRNPALDLDDYRRWLTNPNLTSFTKQALRNLMHGHGGLDGFAEHVAISGKCTANHYYRKMSGAEWRAIEGGDDPFKPVFDFQNADLYRYWMSSSLPKVRAFGNENAVDNGDIIVHFTFAVDLRRVPRLSCSPADRAGRWTAHRHSFATGNCRRSRRRRQSIQQRGKIRPSSARHQSRTRRLVAGIGPGWAAGSILITVCFLPAVSS